MRRISRCWCSTMLKRHNPIMLFKIRLAILSLLDCIVPAVAQTPPPYPVEPPGNDETGISIDRFIGNAANSPVKISHDTMYVQRIFSAGNPATGSAGAVLAPGEQTDLATLLPHDVTSM